MLIRAEDGRLLKPVQPERKGETEVDFYNNLFFKSTDTMDLTLRPFVAQFYGLAKLPGPDTTQQGSQYLILQHISQNYVAPSIMDIKIGSQTYGPHASQSKKEHASSMYPGTRKPFGFSVSGLMVHSIRRPGVVLRHDKSFGEQLRSEDINSIPKVFFDLEAGGRCEAVTNLVEVILNKMKRLYQVFEKQRKYLFYGSSLLLAYDSQAAGHCIQGRMSWQDFEHNWCDVKLIDFAHVYPAHGLKDDNFLRGLTNVIRIFESCLDELKRASTPH